MYLRDGDIRYVLQVLEASLPPKELERHTFGEVFTPLERVDEMLAALPTRLWSDPTKTWLDPAAGIGNFPIRVILGQTEGPHRYPGLWRGLAKAIPDPAKRAKHIVERMVFLVDINPRNNRSARRLFARLFPGLIPNIAQIDTKAGFLTAKPHLQFPHGIQDSFDVIVGNPPFQIGAVKAALVTNTTRRKRQSLGVQQEAHESVYWVKFVEAALQQGRLNPGGFLAYIHPITWFKPDRAGAHDLLLSHQIHTLKIFKNNAQGAAAAFGAHGKISVAWYVLENGKAAGTKPTRIHYASAPQETEDVRLTPASILVLRHNGIFQKILAKRDHIPLFGDAEGPQKILYNAVNPTCSPGSRKGFPQITDIHQDGSLEYVLSKTPHIHQTQPKIVVGGLHTPVVFWDRKGEYGIFAKGQRNYFVGPHAELRAVNTFFQTKLSSLLLNNVKFEQDFIRPAYFPDVRYMEGPITDETLADMYGFTKAEKAAIAEQPEPLHVTQRALRQRACDTRRLRRRAL